VKNLAKAKFAQKPPNLGGKKNSEVTEVETIA